MSEGFEKLVNLTQESFMQCIKQVKHLPESIVQHPHLKDATSLDLSGANLESLPASSSIHDKMALSHFTNLLQCPKGSVIAKL